ncbi:MAG: hypothetical protein RIE56_07535, partial [Amphiplicatus sp.]
HDMHASSLSVSVRLRPDGRWEEARRFPYSQNSFRFLKLFDEIWDQFVTAEKKQPRRGPMRCGAVTVYLHGLASDGGEKVMQADLFTPSSPEDGRQARLWRAIDAINSDPEHKFARLGGAAGEAAGPHKHIMLARQQSLALNYLGAKIAFSRVPEEAEFLY